MSSNNQESKKATNRGEPSNNIQSMAQEYLKQLEAIQIPYEDKEEIRYFVQASLSELKAKEEVNPEIITTAISKIKESMVFGIAVVDFISLANNLIMELEAQFS